MCELFCLPVDSDHALIVRTATTSPRNQHLVRSLALGVVINGAGIVAGGGLSVETIAAKTDLNQEYVRHETSSARRLANLQRGIAEENPSAAHVDIVSSSLCLATGIANSDRRSSIEQLEHSQAHIMLPVRNRQS